MATMHPLALLLLLLAHAWSTVAHIEMKRPAPRCSKFAEGRNGPIDYTNMGPTSDNSDPDEKFNLGFCRGHAYQPGAPLVSYRAGDTIRVELDGTVNHNGGHCEFSFSYDEKTWLSVKTVRFDCIIGAMQYDVPIPKDMPKGRVVFAWTWINRTGNREFYMNCADLDIVDGVEGGSLSGREMIVGNFYNRPDVKSYDFPEVTFNSTGSIFDLAQTVTISPSGSTPAGQKQVSQQEAVSRTADPSTSTPDDTITAGNDLSLTEQQSTTGQTDTQQSGTGTPAKITADDTLTASQLTNAYQNANASTKDESGGQSSGGDVPQSSTTTESHGETTGDLRTLAANLVQNQLFTEASITATDAAAQLQKPEMAHCELGQSRCEEGNIFRCNHGLWVETVCAAGTTCKMDNGHAYCRAAE